MKIAFTASHSTGKTTLVNHFDNKIDEIARTIINEVGSPDEMEQEQGDEFQQEVMDKQIEAELKMGDFVSDRSVIDVLAYATRFCTPKKLRALKDQAEEHMKNNPYDIIFYVPIEFPLEKDGLRFEDEHYQEIIDLQILKYLKRYKIKYITVSGTIEQRLQIINEAIAGHKVI